MYGVLRSAARLGANRDKKPHLPNSTAQDQTPRREDTAVRAEHKDIQFRGAAQEFSTRGVGFSEVPSFRAKKAFDKLHRISYIVRAEASPLSIVFGAYIPPVKST